MPAGEQQIFGDTHPRGDGEVLVNHADAGAARSARRADFVFSLIDQQSPCIVAVIADDAFDEGAFASAVFAQQCMHRSWPHAQ